MDGHANCAVPGLGWHSRSCNQAEAEQSQPSYAGRGRSVSSEKTTEARLASAWIILLIPPAICPRRRSLSDRSGGSGPQNHKASIITSWHDAADSAR